MRSQHFHLRLDAVGVHDIVRILEAQVLAMRLFDAAVLCKATATRAPLVFTIHTRNALLPEMINPFLNNIL